MPWTRKSELPSLQRLFRYHLPSPRALPAASSRSRRHRRSNRFSPSAIDHDEKFNEATHLQYTVSHDGSWMNDLWGGFNWRYDSGQVAGSTPCYGVNDLNSPCGSSSVTLPNGQPGVAMVDTNLPPYKNPVTGIAEGLPLTADEEFQAGFTCNGGKATPTQSPACSLPGQSVHFEPDQHSRAQRWRQRSQPAAHRAAQPLRCVHWQEQYLSTKSATKWTST